MRTESHTSSWLGLILLVARWAPWPLRQKSTERKRQREVRTERKEQVFLNVLEEPNIPELKKKIPLVFPSKLWKAWKSQTSLLFSVIQRVTGWGTRLIYYASLVPRRVFQIGYPDGWGRGRREGKGWEERGRVHPVFAPREESSWHLTRDVTSLGEQQSWNWNWWEERNWWGGERKEGEGWEEKEYKGRRRRGVGKGVGDIPKALGGLGHVHNLENRSPIFGDMVVSIRTLVRQLGIQDTCL